MEWRSSGASAAFSQVESRAALSDRNAARKIYYLDAHPAQIVGAATKWAPHLRRAHALGFDHVCTPPVFAPAESGDLFLAADANCTAVVRGERAPVDEVVTRLATLCRDHDLALLLDVVLDRVAAGSPLAAINDLGPTVVVSDFGNNAGLLLGPAIPDWSRRRLESLTCETFIEEERVGRGGAASLPGGLLEAVAFALGRCARRGLPMKAGYVISTGAATGIHEISIGESARVKFDGVAQLLCRAVPAAKGPRA